MEISGSEEQAKALIKQALLELLQEQRGVFAELMLEALEEAGLASAIREGRSDEFVAESEIAAILRGAG